MMKYPPMPTLTTKASAAQRHAMQMHMMASRAHGSAKTRANAAAVEAAAEAERLAVDAAAAEEAAEAAGAWGTGGGGRRGPTCRGAGEGRVAAELASLTLAGEAASRASPEPAPHPE